MAGIPGAAGPGAPFPQWTYNPATHEVSKVTGALAKAAAETVSWPAKLIFFTSQQAADAYMASQGGGADISKSPLTSVANAGNNAVQSAASGIWSGVPWLRIGEILLGLALIAVGVAKLTDSVPVATKIAKVLS